MDPTTQVIDGCAVHRHGAGPVLVCLPAFADSRASWRLLVDALSNRFEVAVVELPGLNRAGELPVDPDLTSIAALIAGVLKRAWADPLTIVGHSLGSALAVRAAHLLDGQSRSIVSIEGNLTAADAYLTGQAANHDEPAGFVSSLLAQVRQLVAAGQAPASYLDSLATADAGALWTLGHDVVQHSAEDGLGREFAHAPCPTLYLWSRATTPTASRHFLTRQPIRQHELRLGHHWPWVIDPAVLAEQIAGFNSRVDVGSGGSPVV